VGDNELGALEDYITGKVTDLNVQVISGETALNAVAGMAPGAKANALDAQMAQSTSAVRLAQTLGATHLLQVTLTGFDSNKQTINAYGVKATNDERTARVTYKILDGNTGASLAADTVRATKVVQQSERRPRMTAPACSTTSWRRPPKGGRQPQAPDRSRPPRPPPRGRATSPSISRPSSPTSTSPMCASGRKTRSASRRSKLQGLRLAATVEIDGIAVGTAPGQIPSKAGLHKLRVVREGFKPWERTVNLSNGQKLNVALEMTDAGYARWQDATRFINDLKNGAKLTDAEVKVLEGQAKMFEQSGFKVNTKEGIQITNKSLFGLNPPHPSNPQPIPS
jgi:hypothetical protein